MPERGDTAGCGRRATSTARSLSPCGERVGVRGFLTLDFVTPHPPRIRAATSPCGRGEEQMRRRSKQAELRVVRFRLAEVLRRQCRARDVEAEALAGDLEAAAEHPGVRPGALHAGAPLRVVVLAVAGVAHELHH